MWITTALRQCVGAIFGFNGGSLVDIDIGDMSFQIDLISRPNYNGLVLNEVYVHMNMADRGYFNEYINVNHFEAIFNSVPMIGEAQAFVGSALGVVQTVLGIPGPGMF